jgi:hypothetical protein
MQNRLNRSEIITMIVGYWQFINLIGAYLPLLVLVLNSIFDKCDGLSFVDSSSIEV